MRKRTLGATAVAAILVGAAVQYWLLLRGFYSIGLDEAGRTLDAYRWAFTGHIETKGWLPFYRVTVGLALRLFPNLVVTPRVVIGLFGLATIPAAAWLAHELFQHRRTTAVTLVFAALFSQRIALSVAPLSSIQFALCILCAMACLARWLRTGSRASFWGCVLVLAVSETIRYEGWLFAAAFLGVAWLRHPRRASLGGLRHILTVAVPLIGIPALLLAWLVLVHRNPVTAVARASAPLGTAGILRRNPLAEFVWRNALTLNLVGLLPLYRLLRRGEPWRRYWTAAAFAPLGIISAALLLLLMSQTDPAWRMVGVWSLLLLPFTASLIANESWGLARWRFALPVGLAVLLTASALDVARIVDESREAFPARDFLAGAWLRARLESNPAARVLIESGGYRYLNVLLVSDHPDDFVLHAGPTDQNPPQPSLPALKEKGISVLVFESPRFTNYLDRQAAAHKVQQYGQWAIYELR